MPPSYGPLEHRFRIRRIAGDQSSAEFSAAVGAFAASHGFDESTSHFLELAMWEACTNLLKHGYPPEDPGSVKLVVDLFERALRIRLIDQTLAVPAAKLDAALNAADGAVFGFDPDDLANVPESGMGLSLIRAAADAVQYHRRNGCNLLELVKYRG